MSRVQDLVAMRAISSGVNYERPTKMVFFFQIFLGPPTTEWGK